MKGFIESTLIENGSKLLVAISSIAMIEEYANFNSRIVLKERVEESAINLTAVVSQSYQVVNLMIQKSQQE